MAISNDDNYLVIENYSFEWVLPDILMRKMRNVTYVTYMYE